MWELSEERHGCPRCKSAGSVEYGLCQVCLTDYRLAETATQAIRMQVRAPDGVFGRGVFGRTAPQRAS